MRYLRLSLCFGGTLCNLSRDSGHGPWGPIVLGPSVLTLAGVRCRAPRHARLGARNPRYTARRALHFARHRLLVRLRRSPAAASAACRRDPRPPAAAIHARRAASVRCCRRSEAEREHQGRRRRRRPAQHLAHIISAGHDSRRPSCHVWRMGDISCSGPREGQESVVLELARAARATQVLANERQESDETDVADDLSSSASRDHPLARAGAATEWLDDVGVLASTRCQGAAAEDTREREESSGTATPSTCCSVAGTSRAQLHTPLGEGTTPTATAVATEWLDDVGVSNQGGPTVQTSTSAPAWVNAFADVTVSRVASTGTSSACQSHDDDKPVHDDMVQRCICSCFIFVGSLFY